MSKYDGWTIKAPNGFLYPENLRETKSRVINAFEDNPVEPLSWPKFRRKGWKLVKVKLIEVKEEK